MIFYRFYQLNTREKHKNLKELLEPSNNSFKKKFELLKTVSEDQMEFRYLVTSRAGVIKVFFKQNNGTLDLEIKEAPLGFFLPIALLVCSGIQFFLANIQLACFLLGSSMFFLLFIYLNFVYYSNQIKSTVEKLLKL
jgi:hypothetical protein